MLAATSQTKAPSNKLVLECRKTLLCNTEPNKCG